MTIKQKKQKKQQIPRQMNNKPITARVKSGMFKTKEPLLNVGPAGVDGNNKTRTMPSPSKMKGYSMKSSPFKQEVNAADKALETQDSYETYKDGKVILGNKTKAIKPGAVSTGEEIMKTEIRKPITTAEGNAAYEALDQAGKDAQDKRYRDRKENQIQVGTGTFKPGTQEPSTEVETDNQVVAKIARTGQTQQAYESRNNIRRGIQANRKVKKGGVKNARSKAKGGGYYKNDGEFVKASDNKGVGETRKAARVANRAQKKEDKEDLKGVESGKDKRALRKQMKEARKDTKKKAIQKAKDKVRGFKDEKSDAKARQNKRNQDLAKTEARNAQIQSNQGKSGFGTGNKDLVQDEVDLQQGERTVQQQQDSTSPTTMKNPGFFKKKSPMKMNYFKK